MNREQEKIEKFYREFWSYKAENIGMWIGAGFLEVLFGIFMMIPYPEMQSDMSFVALPLMLGFAGGAMYLAPYISFFEGQTGIAIYEKIKYLPIDYREVKKYRLKKLMMFVAKVFVIMFAGQMFFTYFGVGTIRLVDVVYAVLVGYVWPIVSNLPFAMLSK